MQIINLDVYKKTENAAVHAKQHDVGRKFQAVITEGEDPYAIPEGVVFSLWYSGTGGSGNYSAVNGHSAFSVSGNIVTVELSPEMLRCKGGGLMCFAMNDSDGKQLGFWDILYFVEALPGAQSAEAQQHFDAFSEVVAHALVASKQALTAAESFIPDPTLSLSGKPAESAAVGKALAGKAPAGYGLGAAVKTISYSDLDNTRLAGWYKITDLPQGFVGTSSNAYMRVDCFANANLSVPNAVQTMYVISPSNIVIQRFLYSDVWDEKWQYIRPKMSVGIEYLTTELHNGEPVYTKLVDCGFVATGINTVQYHASVVYPIRYAGKIGNKYALPFVGDSDEYARVLVYRNCVDIHKGAGISWDGHGYVQVWYTKAAEGEKYLAITAQPENATASDGDTVYYSVVAEGEGLKYQWQFKGGQTTTWTNTGMVGAKTDTVTVPVTTARNGYQYRCIVSDKYGNSLISGEAKLIVS